MSIGPYRLVKYNIPRRAGESACLPAVQTIARCDKVTLIKPTVYEQQSKRAWVPFHLHRITDTRSHGDPLQSFTLYRHEKHSSAQRGWSLPLPTIEKSWWKWSFCVVQPVLPSAECWCIRFRQHTDQAIDIIFLHIDFVQNFRPFLKKWTTEHRRNFRGSTGGTRTPIFEWTVGYCTSFAFSGIQQK